MPDYSKNNIYKILNTIDDEIHVGSTVKTLGQRMAQHRYNIKTNRIMYYINICTNWGYLTFI